MSETGEKPTKKSRGAPTKLTKEVQDAVILAIKAGSYVETAAAYSGVHKDSLYEWLKKGRKQAKGKYRDFSDAIEKALAEAEVRDVLVIDRAANGRKAEFLRDASGNLVFDSDGDPVVASPAIRSEWTAAAWRLERKFPRKWGRMERVEVSDGDKPSAQSQTREEKEKRLHQLLAKAGAKPRSE